MTSEQFNRMINHWGFSERHLRIKWDDLTDVPEEIKQRIKQAGEGYDVVMVEIGGTVGDYENLPFLFIIFIFNIILIIRQ